MVNTIGHRESERMLGLGMQVDAEAALRMGMVDEAVPLEDVMPRAEALLVHWMKIPAAARFETKTRLRSAALEKLSRPAACRRGQTWNGSLRARRGRVLPCLLLAIYSV